MFSRCTVTGSWGPAPARQGDQHLPSPAARPPPPPSPAFRRAHTQIKPAGAEDGVLPLRKARTEKRIAGDQRQP